MSSLLFDYYESREFKKLLVGPDSPLWSETGRDNGDVTMNDRLEAADNVIMGLRCWRLKRKREDEIYEARKRRRERDLEEDLMLMRHGCPLFERPSTAFDLDYAFLETSLALCRLALVNVPFLIA